MVSLQGKMAISTGIKLMMSLMILRLRKQNRLVALFLAEQPIKCLRVLAKSST